MESKKMRKLSELTQNEKEKLFTECAVCGIKLTEKTESGFFGLCNICGVDDGNGISESALNIANKKFREMGIDPEK
jgi:ribosomal protein S14